MIYWCMVKFPKLKIFRKLKIIGCGCLSIILLFVLLLIIFSGLIIKKLVSGAITQQTGIVQTNNTNSQGQSFTDPKTGATINLGVNKIPDSFPKDFPIYPGATVSSSQTGNGFWLTLLSNDSVPVISNFYVNELQANGWSAVEASTTDNSGTSWAITKGNLSGYLTVDRGVSDKQTSILVVLWEVTK